MPFFMLSIVLSISSSIITILNVQNLSDDVPINNLNKMYTINDNELQLKRAKPVNNSHLNLENTMGLMRIQKKYRQKSRLH